MVFGGDYIVDLVASISGELYFLITVCSEQVSSPFFSKCGYVFDVSVKLLVKFSPVPFIKFSIILQVVSQQRYNFSKRVQENNVFTTFCCGSYMISVQYY